jgi:hypothetical protein
VNMVDVPYVQWNNETLKKKTNLFYLKNK